MRYNDFQLNEEDLKAIARKRYPNLSEEQLDEILPAIGMALGRVGAMGAKVAGKAAGAALKTAGRVGAQMGKAAVKGAAKMAGNAVKSAGQKLAQKAATAVANKAGAQMAQAVLKKGAKLPMPDTQGKEQEFEIDDVKGAEVTLKNPKPKPGEPIKTVHNKKDLDPILKQLSGM
jgi:hypothetical protein